MVSGNLSEKPAVRETCRLPTNKTNWFWGKYGFNSKQNEIDGRAPENIYMELEAVTAAASDSAFFHGFHFALTQKTLKCLDLLERL